MRFLNDLEKKLSEAPPVECITFAFARNYTDWDYLFDVFEVSKICQESQLDQSQSSIHAFGTLKK